jgi:4a-hydroxytetrahydrobiopterin dehydratase
MSELAQMRCKPCEGGTPPLSDEEAALLIEQVPGWDWKPGENRLTRRFKFKDFREAMLFVNSVAGLAEQQGHHPDIYISWNRVRLELTTHIIKGLSENDFIVAARVNALVDALL